MLRRAWWPDASAQIFIPAVFVQHTHRRQSYRGYSVLAVQLALFGAILGSVYFDAAESYEIAGQLYKLVDGPGQVLQAQIGA